MMPTIVQRNALVSVKATAESTTTTQLATATTPLATAESMVTATIMIASRKRPPAVNPIIENLIKMNTGVSGPLEVFALELCSSTVVMYNKFEVLTNRQFTIQQEKRVTHENDPSSATDHIVRQPRF
jgi:hypothetical protein